MERPTRVMWLLNHTTLRQFELDQFKRFGITEIYLPKSFPYDEGNLSASVDTSMDASLSIPPEDLEILNAQNWYETPSEEAWRIANEHFDIVVIAFFMNQIKAATAHFKGAIMLHIFGLSKGYSYTDILLQELGPDILQKIHDLGKRFWFAAGYEYLADIEGDVLRSCACHLPVGLADATLKDEWQGSNKKIFFVCPRIGSSPYFKQIYQTFLQNFEGFDYLIGGAQPVSVDDPKVLGFVPDDVHKANMRSCSVMFYHSQEPNHIHYHPFEAIRSGMPLIFMAEGMLDKLGGKDLPGRCTSIKNARQKIKRILDGDQAFIESVRSSQAVLLSEMAPDHCQNFWQRSLEAVLTNLHISRLRARLQEKTYPKKIAIIIPVAYRGGSLRGAKLLAQALLTGSTSAGEEAEIILGHLDGEGYTYETDFADLSPKIKIRPYTWGTLNRYEAKRAMLYAGHDHWTAEADTYMVPDDGIKHFCDCDLWIIISDRILKPILPVRPYVAMVYDYIQRYIPSILGTLSDHSFIQAARHATRVWVTTNFTKSCAINYAAISPTKVVHVPMLAPDFASNEVSEPLTEDTPPYFMWTTNAASHKNHLNTLTALKQYYEAHNGSLDCLVTGVDTHKVLNRVCRQTNQASESFAKNPSLHKHVKWLGELSDADYRKKLSQATFLCHSAQIDNGTFSVIEAASLNVPALSSQYPAMCEIDDVFKLNLTWMDPLSPPDMARRMKWMEDNALALRQNMSTEGIRANSLENLALAYWKEAKSCL
ncbi:MAG: glycosyltransferase [Alphaproteobacteria bacterium]|nr:glycosyltransferase [Alphaproteobacteria bacterium]